MDTKIHPQKAGRAGKIAGVRQGDLLWIDKYGNQANYPVRLRVETPVGMGLLAAASLARIAERYSCRLRVGH